jgi:hypothetical protein
VSQLDRGGEEVRPEEPARRAQPARLHVLGEAGQPLERLRDLALGDVRALPGPGVQAALADHLQECLADRHAADAEEGGELALGRNPAMWLELTAVDRLADGGLHLGEHRDRAPSVQCRRGFEKTHPLRSHG